MRPKRFQRHLTRARTKILQTKSLTSQPPRGSSNAAEIYFPQGIWKESQFEKTSQKPQGDFIASCFDTEDEGAKYLNAFSLPVGGRATPLTTTPSSAIFSFPNLLVLESSRASLRRQLLFGGCGWDWGFLPARVQKSA